MSTFNDTCLNGEDSIMINDTLFDGQLQQLSQGTLNEFLGDDCTQENMPESQGSDYLRDIGNDLLGDTDIFDDICGINTPSTTYADDIELDHTERNLCGGDCDSTTIDSRALNIEIEGHVEIDNLNEAAVRFDKSIIEYSPSDLIDICGVSIDEFSDPSQADPYNHMKENEIDDFSDHYLATVETKSFNRKLRSLGVSSEIAKSLKKRRRTLKNRGYAQNCRIKRIDNYKEMREENDKLRKAIKQLVGENRRINNEKIKMMEKYEALTRQLASGGFPRTQM